MTRIVQLANFYGPTTGGLKTVVEELARQYGALGVERVLIAPGPADRRERTDHGTRIFLRAPVVPGTGGYRVITATRALEALLERLEPDAVEVSDKLTLVAAARWARRRGVPCALLSHERIDAILASRVPAFVPLARAADVWNARLARLFDTVVCPSGFAREEFDRVGATNAVVVPWGVDLDTFSPDASRGTDRRAAVELVCVGRLSREKEPQLAIEVAAELERRGVDVHLTMVGTGPMRASLECRAGRRVTFTGHVADRRRVAALLAGADVSLAPCRAENFGLAVLESLACGTPVVTSTSGAAAEVCGVGAGLAVPSGVGPMADAVAALARRDRAVAGRRARQRAEQFGWERAARAVLAAHLGSPARPGRLAERWAS
jgi:alpha-1,6-mannosyltransferase